MDSDATLSLPPGQTRPATRTRQTRAQARHSGVNRPITRRQHELRELAFFMHVEGYTLRQIAAKLDINRETAGLYVKAETERRAPQFEKDRETATLRAVAFYEAIKRRALDRADAIQELLETISEATEYEGQVRIQEHYLADATKAQERIDKILGTDAPVKSDATMQLIADAIRTPDEPDRPLGKNAK